MEKVVVVVGFIKTQNPDIDTLLVSINRIYPGNPLIEKAKELNLNLICGNSHTMEIYENGLLLAFALKKYLKNPNIVIFIETVTSIPLENTSTETLRNYGKIIANKSYNILTTIKNNIFIT